jgi:hypothetical protein
MYPMPQFSPNSDTITVEIAPDGSGCVVTLVQSGEDIAHELRELPAGGTSARLTFSLAPGRLTVPLTLN